MTHAAGATAAPRHRARLGLETGLFVIPVAMVAVIVPALVLHRLGLPGTIGLTGVAVMLATAMLGWRVGLLSAGTLTFGLVVADVAAHNRVSATLVMILVSVAFGLSARRGWQWGLMLTAIQFAVVTADPPTRDLTVSHPVSVLDMFLVTAATTAFAVGTIWLLTRGRALSVEKPIAADRVVPYAAMLGVAAAITTPIVLSGHFKGAPALMVTPIIVLEPYWRDGMIGRLLDRGWGVIVGSLLAIGAAVTVDADWAIYLVAAIAAGVALHAKVAKWPYRRYVEGLTAAVVLYSGSSAVIVADGRDRMLATALGIAICAAIAAAMLPFLRRARREDASTATSATASP